jgi:hypothetical protein
VLSNGQAQRRIRLRIGAPIHGETRFQATINDHPSATLCRLALTKLGHLHLERLYGSFKNGQALSHIF